MEELTFLKVVLAVIVGMLLGLLYAARFMVLMYRRIARIEEHIDRIVHEVLNEEKKISRSLKKR